MKKVLTVLLTILVVGAVGCGKPGEKVKKEEPPLEKGFSKEVEEILAKKIDLIKGLAKDPLIVKQVRESNEKDKGLSLSEILKLDKHWRRTEGLDEFIKSFLTNECANKLIEFQEAHEEFPEIFVSNEKGLIVGETNKTSDYYQADEDWWIEAYNKGQGKSYHGEIEYDASSHTEAICVYVPVMDPKTKKTIGVIKAIVDITAIKMEL